MQSVPITTNVVSSNPVYDEVYTIQHYVIKVCQLLVDHDHDGPFQKWSYILWINRYTYKVNFLVLFRDTSRQTLSSWTRLVGQTCRIPNNLHNMLPGGRKGCFVLKFSHDGRYVNFSQIFKMYRFVSHMIVYMW
jgi:hypothetical protein